MQPGFLFGKGRYCDYPSFWPPIQVGKRDSILAGLQPFAVERGEERVDNLLLVPYIASSSSSSSSSCGSGLSYVN